MKDYSKNLYLSFILLLIFLFYGSFLILNPNSAISLVSMILSALIFIFSVNLFIRYFLREDKTKKMNLHLIFGILTAVVAAFLFFKKTAIEGLIPPSFGAFILINTSLKVQSLLELKKSKNTFTKLVALIILVEYLLSFAIIFNVFSKVLILTQIVGLTGIFYFLLDFILTYLLSLLYQTTGNFKLIEGETK